VHRTHAPSGCEAAGTIEGYPERIGRIRVAPVFRSAAPTEKRVPPEPKQEIAGFIVLIADVSERRAQERALADREEKLRIAVDATQMGLWSFDVRSNHVVWDDRVSAIYGRDRPMTTFDEWRSALHPEDADRAIAVVERALRAGVFEPMEHRIIKPSGEVCWVQCVATVFSDETGSQRLVGALFDITRRRAIEEQLRTTQKMDAVGQLTAGIAHNFNNMLAGMLPVLEVVETKVSEPWRTRVAHARYAGQRAADMVSQLMTFARPATMKPRSAEAISEIVTRAVGMCREAIQPTVGIRAEPSAHLANRLVMADASELEQVLVNMMLNARDALAHAVEPCIEIQLYEVDDLDTELRHRASVTGTVLSSEHRSFVRVRVTDNGSGMPKAVQERMFDPFYTTKEIGKGTGLGLATAYAIVRDHGGFIWCESFERLGTTFDTYLPLVQGAGVHLTPRSLAAAHGVLVVDDDATVRTVVAEVLREHGYAVFTAEGGSDALLQAAQRRPGIAFLDYAMPGRSGVQVATELRAQNPGIKIVIFTGRITDDVIAFGADAILAKPASADAIVATVRRTLAAD
jgi:two-component system, cell cycle sensor histidine kinase and response regulator CckA